MLMNPVETGSSFAVLVCFTLLTVAQVVVLMLALISLAGVIYGTYRIFRPITVTGHKPIDRALAVCTLLCWAVIAYGTFQLVPLYDAFIRSF